MNIRIFQFLLSTITEGPGKRACIQVQGCPIHCPGCAVPNSWSSTAGRLVNCDTLTRSILETPNIEGVTFLGGEPFFQASALAKIGRDLQCAGLSVVTFTGYTYETILSKNRKDYNDLLAVTDLLIDGPFQKENVDMSRPWIGSKNQRYHFLTKRYRHLEPILNTIPNRIEVRIKSDGRIFVNGLALIEQMEYLIK